MYALCATVRWVLREVFTAIHWGQLGDELDVFDFQGPCRLHYQGTFRAFNAPGR